MYVYQSVYLAQLDFIQVSYVHMSPDGSIFKGFHQKIIITSLIVSFYSQYLLSVLEVWHAPIVLTAGQLKYFYRTPNIMLRVNLK